MLLLLVVIMFSFGYFAPAERLAGKIVPEMTCVERKQLFYPEGDEWLASKR